MEKCWLFSDMDTVAIQWDDFLFLLHSGLSFQDKRGRLFPPLGLHLPTEEFSQLPTSLGLLTLWMPGLWMDVSLIHRH